LSTPLGREPRRDGSFPRRGIHRTHPPFAGTPAARGLVAKGVTATQTPDATNRHRHSERATGVGPARLHRKIHWAAERWPRRPTRRPVSRPLAACTKPVWGVNCCGRRTAANRRTSRRWGRGRPSRVRPVPAEPFGRADRRVRGLPPRLAVHVWQHAGRRGAPATATAVFRPKGGEGLGGVQVGRWERQPPQNLAAGYRCGGGPAGGAAARRDERPR